MKISNEKAPLLGCDEYALARKQKTKDVYATIVLALLAAAINYDTLAVDDRIYCSLYFLFPNCSVLGIVLPIQRHFHILDSATALIKTLASGASCIVFTVIWLFGERVSRRSLLIVALVAWTVFNTISFFSEPKMYAIFLTCRTLAGGCSAIFLVLLPVTFGDMYEDRALGRALMFNALSGMISGCISTSVSSWFVTSGLSWWIALLPGPAMAAVLTPLLAYLLPKNSTKIEPKRKHSVMEKVVSIMSIKTYVMIVFGLSLGLFYLKSSLFWMPTFLISAWTLSPTVYLDLPYAAVISIKSFTELSGSLLGLPILVFAAESWHYGFNSCSGYGGYQRAIPAVVALVTTFAGIAGLGQIYMSDKNYIGLVAAAFINSFMAAPIYSLGTQMLLNVCPKAQRTSAISLVNLITGIVTLPAEQVIGGISDAIRGGSDTVESRYYSYRGAMVFNWMAMAVAWIFHIGVVIFYPGDHRRVIDEDNVVDETEPVLESILETTEEVIEEALIDYETFIGD